MGLEMKDESFHFQSQAYYCRGSHEDRMPDGARI